MWAQTIGLFLLSSVPFVAHAQRAPRTFSELAYYAVDLMGYAIGTLVLAGLVLYFYGSIQHLWKAKDGGNSADRSRFFLVGIIILFVMVSVWGILQILENTLFGGGQNVNFGGGASDPGFISNFEGD